MKIHFTIELNINMVFFWGRGVKLHTTIYSHIADYG